MVKFRKKRGYRKKRYNKKRKFNKYRNYQNTLVKGFGMPRNLFTKFKITSLITLTTGTLANNTLLVNSLYDAFNAFFS